MGLSPEKVMMPHRDDYHPVCWVELHPAVTSERNSQNSGRWRKLDLGPAEHAVAKDKNAPQ